MHIQGGIKSGEELREVRQSHEAAGIWACIWNGETVKGGGMSRDRGQRKGHE